jgi:site-specific recombinase XerD
VTTAHDDVPSVGTLLQAYFCEHLIAQRDISPATVRSYRDTFRLLLAYAHEMTRTRPTDLALHQLDAPLVVGFLAHLEKDRGNSVRSRNARLAAIHSFLSFVALRCPTVLPSLQRVQAIPMKRFSRPLLGFLSREEVAALLEAPDRGTWSGQRDHVLLTTLYNTGARVSEITRVRVLDLDVHGTQSVRIHGKGRKERAVPLWPSTCDLVRRWIRFSKLTSEAPVFPNRFGEEMSRSGVEKRLAAALALAAASCPSLRGRRVSPHTLRHTTAMHLLQAGVDITVIALWLGHENPVTTHQYVEADLAMKKRALDRVTEPRGRPARVVPSDAVLAFLDGL